MELKRQIVRNVYAGGIQFVFNFAYGLVLPPYILHKIGVNNYSLWVLLTAVSGYVQFIEFGSSSSLVKHIADSKSADRYDLVSGYLSSVFVLFVVGSIFAEMLAYYGINIIGPYFFSNFGVLANLRNLVSGFVLISILMLFNGLFSCVLKAWQRVDIINAIAIIVSSLNITLIFFFLNEGLEIKGILYSYLSSSSLGLVLTVLFSRKIVKGKLVLNIFEFDYRLVRDILRLGSSDQLIRVLGILWGPVNKTIIQNFAGPQYLVAYDLTMRVISQVSSMPSMIFNPLLPAMAELNAKNDRSRLWTLFKRSLNYIMLAGAPLVVLFFFFANPIIAIWLRGPNDLVADTIRVLILSTFINILTGPLYMGTLAFGKPALGIIKTIVTFLTNVGLLVIALSLHLGYYGVVAAEFIGVLTGAIYFLVKFDKSYGESVVYHILKGGLRIFGLALASGFCVFLIPHVWTGFLPVYKFPSLSALCFLYFGCVGGGYYLLGYVGKYEYDLVKGAIFRSRAQAAL